MKLCNVSSVLRVNGVTGFPRATFLAAAAGSAVLSALWLAGCGSSDKRAAGAESSKGAIEVRKITIDHEPCGGGGQKTVNFDTDRDGKPDVTKVYDRAGHEVCRVTDLNRDGKPDMFEYYGPGGEPRRREASYVDSGEITTIETFEGGKRVRKELDTTGQRRIDTWDYYDGASGKRLRRECDLNGDGRIDQWWQWDGDKITIAIDRSGDGLPDPESTIVMNGDTTGAPAAGAPGLTSSGPPDAGAVPPATAATSSSPAFPSFQADAGGPNAASGDAGATKASASGTKVKGAKK